MDGFTLPPPPQVKRQRGATLLVSLVLLLLLTVLALVSARTATLQQRMANNLQQQNYAFQAAESGIAAAILRLRADSTQWPLNIGDKKWLCGENNNFAPWSNNACTLSGGYGYHVIVSRVGCKDNSGNICFDIKSDGIHLENKAVHQVGFTFAQDDISSEGMLDKLKPVALTLSIRSADID